MSGGGGRSHFAAGGVVLGAIFVALLVGPGIAQAQYQRGLVPVPQNVRDDGAATQDTTDGQREDTSGPHAVETLPAEVSVEQITREEITSGTNEECNEACQRNKEDLRAQQDMADAAWRMVLLGLCSLALTVVGVFLVWRTLVHTRAAAIAAREAVVVTREIGEAQIRTYIYAEPDVPILLPKRRVVVDFTIRNGGQTPAYRVRHLSWVGFLDHPLADNQGDLVAPEQGQRIPESVLPPGTKLVGQTGSDEALTGDEYNAIKQGEGGRALYLAVIVSYEDVFGIEWDAKFCFYVAKRQDRVGGIAWGWELSHVHNTIQSKKQK
jgi:hypothetical protein